jgi:hypothetical protein
MNDLKLLSEYHFDTSCWLPEKLRQQISTMAEKHIVCDGRFLPVHFNFLIDNNKLTLTHLSRTSEEYIEGAELDGIVSLYSKQLPMHAEWVNGVYLLPFGKCLSSFEVVVPPNAWELYHLVEIKHGAIVSCYYFDNYAKPSWLIDLSRYVGDLSVATSLCKSLEEYCSNTDNKSIFLNAQNLPTELRATENFSKLMVKLYTEILKENTNNEIDLKAIESMCMEFLEIFRMHYKAC